jgi:hypothetical protein
MKLAIDKIDKQDRIAIAAGLGVGLFLLLAVFPKLPVIDFFAGLMVFALTQKHFKGRNISKPSPNPEVSGAADPRESA